MEQESLFSEKDKHTLTVLSFGAGQDSRALLERYICDPNFKEKYAPNDFVVVISATGDEHPETYMEIKRAKRRCKDFDIPFFYITPDMGHHSPSWESLRHFYRTKTTIGSAAFPRTCTDRLKMAPFYSFLEGYLSEKYGVVAGRKKGYYHFASQFGKVRVLIGISRGEERRLADHSKDPKKWFRECIEIQYPLVDLGMDRKDCQEYIRDAGQIVPPPSNCILCHFANLTELEYLRRFDPESAAEWIQLEANKIAKYRHLDRIPVTEEKRGTKTPTPKKRNLGVYGLKLLPEKFEEARTKHIDWSDQEIKDYRFSHGHCAATKY
jgi:hypothetical protein